jgi:hypothetical protein
LAKSLEIPINPEFEKLVINEGAPKSINFKAITFYILGSTKRPRNIERGMEKLT